ncbi:MAG: hypothetical protein WCT07_00860 [Candidatus Paceibacterota bacterium]
MEKSPYLKDRQEYIDRYDRMTVGRCRRLEKSYNEKDTSLPKVKGVSKKQAEHMRKVVADLFLHFETGEMYLNKEKTIQEWMDSDRKRDELYESAQAPEDMRCLTCRNRLKPTFKELWSELNKEDRVLFMYDCPNQCLPRRAFFSDGEEWRVKPDLCPHCNSLLKRSEKNTSEKLVTTFTCSKCKYSKTEDYIWTKKEAEDIDENFAIDRDRFCLTHEAGKKYQEEKWGLQQMAKFSEEWKEKEKAREEKLKENPNGFHLDGVGYTCFICGHSTHDKGDNWYDRWGIKCLICQNAIDKKEIPASLAKLKDSWYSKYDIESSFNLKSPTIRKWVKDGVLKARNVSCYGKGVHTQLFLIKDNKDFLPPKKLVQSRSLSEIKDGETYHHMEPWYKFVDPHEHLKGYKIMDYLKVVPLDDNVKK